MESIEVRVLPEEELKRRGIPDWPVWEKEESVFDWHYDTQEQCYILEGSARVKPSRGKAVEFKAGDFVTFPAGMDCVWEIKEKIKKHYNFD
ncbi:MAG: cupin domain-containing protein [Elusimicrobia bacterium]|nr:cupin domain-containing protein [Elusimicrobiota bacterium]